MLTEKQIKEIREHLDNAQNPLFLFDNDQDGLCSFLVLQRYLGRGKGFPIKGSPMDKNYFRKIDELEPDYLFILDVPEVSEEFFDKLEKINLPVVWIDHHLYNKKIPEFVCYYNPFCKESKLSSTTDLCYQITKRKEDLWLAVVGSISDKFVPNYYEDFKEEFPELTIDSEDAFKIYYGSEIGKVAQILGYGLKDTTTNVIKMLKFLMKSKGPYDVLKESPKNREMHDSFKKVFKKYMKFLEKAIEMGNNSDKLVFFEYSSDTSMSSELANHLSYLFPGKFIFVVRIKEGSVNISGRGKNVKKILENVLEHLENAKGGGHKDAVGGKIMKQDLQKFKEKIIKYL